VAGARAEDGAALAGYDKRVQRRFIDYLNAWCELAKSLKSEGGFPDTRTESRLVQRLTLLFSITAFQ
jgi:hypothetical protein